MKNLSNNWKLTIRNLVKQKRASTLNVVGLAFGFAAVLFLGIYVHREFSYDNFHESAERIFKPGFEIIEAKADIDMASNLTLDQVEMFRDNTPGIEAISFLNYSRWDWDDGTWIEYNDTKYILERMAFSDRYFDDVFSFKTHSGQLTSTLEAPDKLVITKGLADKIFQNEDPIGKVVHLNNKAITIGAILEEIPSNSSIQISGLVSYKSAKYFFGNEIKDWTCIPFIKAKSNTDPVDVSQSMSSVLRNSLPEKELKQLDPVFQTNLVPLQDLYFQPASAYDPIKHGSITLAYVLLAIGIVILFLAIINYCNLLLATTLKWKKDFGIQKVLGANRNTESIQLFIKGFLISMTAFVIGILILNLALPWLNGLVNYPLLISDFLGFKSLVIASILLIVTILFSGLIPSFFNSNSTPLAQIKSDFITHKNNGGVWKSLVTFQLFISISLIIGAIVITKQINYGLKKDIGINVKNVVTVPTHKLGDKQNAFINTVSDHIQTISSCRSTSYINTFTIRGGPLKEPNKEKQGTIYNMIRVNHSFIKTLGLDLVQGRNFLEEENKDKGAMIVNEAFIKKFEIDKPLEATVRDLPIVGVVKDFNFNSLRYEIEPAVLWNSPDRVGLSSIHFEATIKADVKNYMSFLESEWKKIRPDKPFEFEFIDDRMAIMYKEDITLAKSVVSLSLLAIFIACLGIFGLFSFLIEIRIKEIGIRKVNGAKVFEILKLVNFELIKWVSIALLIAIPFAYFAMNLWLENFAYKTTLSWWIFALAGVLALGIALLTVSWQSWRAATRNPVEALRYE